MVIVGAGEAGARAATALRQQGWEGAITLIGDEPHLPYERPPLSKSAMVSETEPDAKVIASHAKLEAAGITFLHGVRVHQIDRATRHVACEDGRSIPYAKLLVATGARARRLTCEGAEAALYLRNFSDALALRTRLRPGARLVIVGGGFIGLEIAASAVARGCHVSMVELGERILMRGVPGEIADHVAARHARAGVEIRVGIGLTHIAANGDGHVVGLEDGSEIACDGVVAGVGAIPETALAEAGGLATENGVRCDETLHTSDPDILAAGDCCSFPAPLFDGARLRLEAWRNAQDHGALAARNMLGANLPYDAVPWFWSDQYEQTLQVSGLPTAAITTVRRDMAGDALLFFHLAESGRLMAASAVGPLSLSREVRVAEMLIARRAHPDPAALASADVKLKSLLPGP